MDDVVQVVLATFVILDGPCMARIDDGDVFYIPETHYKMEWIDMYIWI